MLKREHAGVIAVGALLLLTVTLLGARTMFGTSGVNDLYKDFNASVLTAAVSDVNACTPDGKYCSCNYTALQAAPYNFDLAKAKSTKTYCCAATQATLIKQYNDAIVACKDAADCPAATAALAKKDAFNTSLAAHGCTGGEITAQCLAWQQDTTTPPSELKCTPVVTCAECDVAVETIKTYEAAKSSSSASESSMSSSSESDSSDSAVPPVPTYVDCYSCFLNSCQEPFKFQDSCPSDYYPDGASCAVACALSSSSSDSSSSDSSSSDSSSSSSASTYSVSSSSSSYVSSSASSSTSSSSSYSSSSYSSSSDSSSSSSSESELILLIVGIQSQKEYCCVKGPPLAGRAIRCDTPVMVDTCVNVGDKNDPTDDVTGTYQPTQIDCQANCTWCGDGVKQAGEFADNGDPTTDDPFAPAVAGREGVEHPNGTFNIPAKVANSVEVQPSQQPGNVGFLASWLDALKNKNAVVDCQESACAKALEAKPKDNNLFMCYAVYDCPNPYVLGPCGEGLPATCAVPRDPKDPKSLATFDWAKLDACGFMYGRNQTGDLDVYLKLMNGTVKIQDDVEDITGQPSASTYSPANPTVGGKYVADLLNPDDGSIMSDGTGTTDTALTRGDDPTLQASVLAAVDLGANPPGAAAGGGGANPPKPPKPPLIPPGVGADGFACAGQNQSCSTGGIGAAKPDGKGNYFITLSGIVDAEEWSTLTKAAFTVLRNVFSSPTLTLVKKDNTECFFDQQCESKICYYLNGNKKVECKMDPAAADPYDLNCLYPPDPGKDFVTQAGFCAKAVYRTFPKCCGASNCVSFNGGQSSCWIGNPGDEKPALNNDNRLPPPTQQQPQGQAPPIPQPAGGGDAAGGANGGNAANGGGAAGGKAGGATGGTKGGTNGVGGTNGATGGSAPSIQCPANVCGMQVPGSGGPTGNEYCAATGQVCSPTTTLPCFVCTGGSSSSGSGSSLSSSSAPFAECPVDSCNVDNDSVPGPDGVAFCAQDPGGPKTCRSTAKFPCIVCVSGGSSSSSSSAGLCGNKVVDNGEQCGEPGLSCNFGATCNNCQCQLCGDGVKQGTEQCDDGNNVDNDGCSAKCTIEKCGDKIVQKPGEQCDNGSVCNVNASMSCVLDSDCRVCKAVAGGTAKRCGGGGFGTLCNVDADCGSETQITCAYNAALDPKCSNNCQSTSGGSSSSSSSQSSSVSSSSSRSSSVSSNGSNGSGVSSSKSSSSTSGTACTTDLNCLNCQICVSNKCTQVPGCTPGSSSSKSTGTNGGTGGGGGSSTSNAGSSVSSGLCGNNVLNTGEQCDGSANTCSFGGTCKNCQCQLCGNRVIEGDETCDDGNNASNDGCSATCQIEKCGDGVVQSYEQCDNGSVCSQNASLKCTTNAQCRACIAVVGGAKRCGGSVNGILCNVDTDCAAQTQLTCTYNTANTSCNGACQSTVTSAASSTPTTVACTTSAQCGTCAQCVSNRCVAILNCNASSTPTASCFNNFDCGTCQDCVSGLCRTDTSCQSSSQAACYTNFDCGTCQECNSNRCISIPNCGGTNGTIGINGTIGVNSTFVGTNGTISTNGTNSTIVGTNGGTTGGGTPVSICGDGIRERGEICDDGNQINDDACSNDCRLNPTAQCTSPAQCESRLCKNGVCTSCTLDEECPSGHRCVAGNCVVAPPTCGNGRLEAGEQCDDGNANNNDACSNDCLLGTSQSCTYDYQCDSGRCINGVCSKCLTDDQCPAGLACINGGCLKTVDVSYTPNFCGNGILEPGEACDLGAQNSDKPNAACRPDCTRGRCGDGVLDTPLEACDDGNTLPGDGCNSLCQVEPGGPKPGTTTGGQNGGGLAQIPFLPGKNAGGQGGTNATFGDIVRPRPPTGGGVQGDSGPATVAVMAAGAAAGTAWARRRFGKKKK